MEEENPQVKTKYNFVGHITYPYLPAVYNVLFEKNPTKMVDVISRDGVFIKEHKLEPKLKENLIKLGYEITRKKVDAPKTNKKIKSLAVYCDNVDCPYRHIYGHKCRINITSTIERKKMSNNKRVPVSILVSFKTRDLNETTQKTACIRQYIKVQSGIDGEPDTYAKMERC
jgi:hypothetical protein